VMGSRVSVIPFFIKMASKGELPITDENMTRFNITLDEGVDMVLYAIENAWGGEVFVPKIPSYKITEVAKAIGPNCQTNIIGVRPGEKIHEEMITETDSLNTLDCGKYYVILPSTPIWDVKDFTQNFSGKAVPVGFKYNSGDNTEWVTAPELQELIKTHVDPSFQPVV
ncbi:MAG: polysaccharide biosynthesis protein, partial [Bdellovibrionales bacterium]|nr:polysaccharide biosynthesis protein [Bdellovibrionales bacterium]